MKTLFLLLTGACSLWAQSASPVNQITGPPPFSFVTLLFYSGSNLTYACYAPALQPTTSYTIGATPGLTNIVVATNVGTINFAATSQLWVGQTVTVSGSTTSALNGSYRINTVSGSTATIATSGVSDGTYSTAALVVSTTGPTLDAPKWSIQVLTYSGSNLTATFWAGTPNQVPNNQLACANRANY